jgi:hypothetical protein
MNNSSKQSVSWPPRITPAAQPSGNGDEQLTISPAAPGRTAPHVLQQVSTSRTPCKRARTLANLKRQRPTGPCTTASRRPTRICYTATKLTPSATRITSNGCTQRTGLRPQQATGSTLTNFKHPRHPYRALSRCCAIRCNTPLWLHEVTGSKQSYHYPGTGHPHSKSLAGVLRILAALAAAGPHRCNNRPPAHSTLAL